MLARFMHQHSAKCLIVLLFLIPAVASIWGENSATQENRTLAPLPARPHSWEQALRYPGQFERWANDHVGLRAELVGLNNRIRYRLFHHFPTSQVLKGKNGRLFLADHTYAPGRYGAIQDVCGYQFRDLPGLVNQLNLFGSTMQAQGLDGHLMIVPTASVIYPEDIPDWLARRCQGKPIPMEMAFNDPQLRYKDKMIYPLAQLLAAKSAHPVFPKTWYHWAGAGPRIAADLSMQKFWPTGLAEVPPIPVANYDYPSDISHLFPGLRLSSNIEGVNFAVAGIKDCQGATCYPELSGFADKLWGINRFHNPKAKLARLVMVTDSFGLSLGQWYSRYYRDVIQIASNDFGRLSPTEMQQLKQFLFGADKDQYLLFVYHDGTLQSGNRIVGDMGTLFKVGK